MVQVAIKNLPADIILYNKNAPNQHMKIHYSTTKYIISPERQEYI